jgi:hypothetical protein
MIRNLLGIRTRVLAVPLTLCALADPQRYPMVDNQVAEWVNSNAILHNKNRSNHLTLFNKKYTSLQDDDFTNYLHWIAWCREVSQVLTIATGEE